MAAGILKKFAVAAAFICGDATVVTASYLLRGESAVQNVGNIMLGTAGLIAFEVVFLSWLHDNNRWPFNRPNPNAPAAMYERAKARAKKYDL
jgi:hypothetical protein